MKTNIRNTVLTKAILAGMLCLPSTQLMAISIQFDYSYDTNNFFDTQAKKDVLNAAGNYFGGIIQDDLLAISSAGSNQFDAVFGNPATGATTTINGFSVAADTLVIYAGGRNFSGSTLAVGGTGGYGVSGSSSFAINAITRGETTDVAGVQGAAAYETGPWGGSVSFDTSSNWYFDPDLSTDADVVNNDFYSVALHEIGHVLGIGLADSWSNLIASTLFTGTASSAVNGGSVALDSGLAHWANGTSSLVNGVFQDAAMDPSINTGTRKVFTDLDNAGLTDIGWNVSAVPVPAAVWLFGSGLLALVGFARRRA